jgi:hypothetical protein
VYSEEKKCIHAGRLEQPRQDKNCTGTTIPMNQSRKVPFNVYSLSPNLPQFQESAWATPLSIVSLDPTTHSPSSSEHLYPSLALSLSSHCLTGTGIALKEPSRCCGAFSIIRAKIGVFFSYYFSEGLRNRRKVLDLSPHHCI